MLNFGVFFLICFAIGILNVFVSQNDISSSLRCSLFPERLTIEYDKYEQIRNRVNYELAEMSDFMDYFLEELETTLNDTEFERKINFIGSEFKNRKK
jgi:hypothetical protein